MFILLCSFLLVSLKIRDPGALGKLGLDIAWGFYGSICQCRVWEMWVFVHYIYLFVQLSIVLTVCVYISHTGLRSGHLKYVHAPTVSVLFLSIQCKELGLRPPLVAGLWGAAALPVGSHIWSHSLHRNTIIQWVARLRISNTDAGAGRLRDKLKEGWGSRRPGDESLRIQSARLNVFEGIKRRAEILEGGLNWRQATQDEFRGGGEH